MLEKNVSLASHSNFKIGGPARFFFAAKDIAGLQKAVQQAYAAKLPIFILGGGTNLLISDKGFAGLVIKAAFSELKLGKEELLTVGSGVLVKDLLDFCIAHSLSGLEWAGGLPGTVGGAIWGNAGAFGGEIKDSVAEVASVLISADSSGIIRRNNSECKFNYRTSIFKENTGRGIYEIIVDAAFRLKKGDKEKIKAVVEEKIAYRQAKQPLEYPNIGSIFKNVDVKKIPPEVLKKFEHKLKTDPFPVIPTAVLIDAAGLKGKTIGGAMISPKHPNFIVNVLSASDQDVRQLMQLIRSEIKKQFGVELEQEVIFV